LSMRGRGSIDTMRVSMPMRLIAAQAAFMGLHGPVWRNAVLERRAAQITINA
jgi:hypothetical protein